MPNITVTVQDAAGDAVDQIAATLQASGMQISQVLEGIGIITGFVPDGGEALLRDIDGVKSVDHAVDVALPSPDSPLQ